MQIPGEYELIQGCLRKDSHCQEILYKTYYNVLLKICARYVTNMMDAESLMNDSFLKILIRGLILLSALIINVYAQKLRSNTDAAGD